MLNNNKMIENYAQKIWVKNVVLLGWFSFQKLCTKGLSENSSYLWLVSIFGRFSYLGSCFFVLSSF